MVRPGARPMVGLFLPVLGARERSGTERSWGE